MLSDAHFVLIFGHLLQGDASSAQKEHHRIRGEEKLKLGIVEGRDNEKGCLAVSAGRVLGVEFDALVDTGATPNVMSTHVVRGLFLKTREDVKVSDSSER